MQSVDAVTSWHHQTPPDDAAACLIFKQSEMTHVRSLHWLPLAAASGLKPCPFPTKWSTAPAYPNFLLLVYNLSCSQHSASEQKIRGRTFQLCGPTMVKQPTLICTFFDVFKFYHNIWENIRSVLL